MMEPTEQRVVDRYFRKTSAYPEGSVTHHGDCDFFSIKICTCGLHHDLLLLEHDLQMAHYPAFSPELAEYEVRRTNLIHFGIGKKKPKA